MAKNCGEWGKDKARERYAGGGAAKDDLPEHPSPPIQPKEWPPHPMRASGGRANHSDVAEDRALIRKMVSKSSLKRGK